MVSVTLRFFFPHILETLYKLTLQKVDHLTDLAKEDTTGLCHNSEKHAVLYDIT